MGILYVVATPIGNLEDITIRAIKILLTVPVIACEDTRRTGLLIKLLESKKEYPFVERMLLKGVSRRFISVRDWNEVGVVDQIVRELEFNDVALVSDGGTPLISDPGYKLVSRARELGINVIPIPGPSAVTAALSVAGLPTNKFVFWGFWNRKYELVAGATNVFFESPIRQAKMLNTIREKHPEAQIRVVRELTKIHEEILDVNSDTAELSFKGEITVLVYLPKSG